MDIELNGQSKTWIGEQRWMHACRATATPPDLLIYALMALEKWLSDQLDDDQDISNPIRYLLSNSQSMAIIGVCLQLAKKQPELFTGVCADLLNIPEIFIYDLHHVEQDEQDEQDAMIGFGFEYSEIEYNTARAWHLREYRKAELQKILLPMWKNDDEFKAIVDNDMLPAFRNWLSKLSAEDGGYKFMLGLMSRFDLSQ